MRSKEILSIDVDSQIYLICSLIIQIVKLWGNCFVQDECEKWGTREAVIKNASSSSGISHSGRTVDLDLSA